MRFTEWKNCAQHMVRCVLCGAAPPGGPLALGDALRANPHLRDRCRAPLDAPGSGGPMAPLCGVLFEGRVGLFCDRAVVCVPQPCDRM